MKNSKEKTIEIIKDIELTIIGKVFANCCYKHDGIGRPVYHKDLSDIHTKLCQLPSMIKASAKYNEKEKFLCEEFGYEFTPLFKTIEQMEIRGKLLFDEDLKRQEERDNQHDADSQPTIADDENSKYFNFGKK
jgi:hypothetical protein